MVRDTRGTTLVEILVSVAIIGILSSVFFVNVRSTDREILMSYAEQLASDLRQVRNLAISRTIYDMEDGLKYPNGGYGIDVNTDTYFKYKIFAESSLDDYGFDINDDEVIEEVKFADNIKIINEETGCGFFITFSKSNDIKYTGGFGVNPKIITIVNGELAVKITLNYNSFLIGNQPSSFWGNIYVGNVEESYSYGNCTSPGGEDDI